MKYTYRTAVRQSEAIGGEPTFRVNLYADNRRVRGRGGFTSRAEAEQWGAEQCVLLKHAGPDVLPRAVGVTFAALAKLYLEAPTNSDALTGANQPLQHQNDVRWWTERLGRLPLASVDQEHIRAALQQYLDSPAHRWDRKTQRAVPTNRKPKPSSRNRKLAAVRRVFRFAMQKNMLTANPAALVDPLRENNAIARGLSLEQQKALLRACRHSSYDRLYLFVALALTTGARRSEILGLTWDRVDLTAGTAFVPVTKNGDSKTLLLTPTVISELRRFRGLGLVFPGAADPRTPFNPRAAWSRAVRDAGLESVRIHDLRHSVAVNMIRGGATLEQIAAQLGHRDLSSSARYAKLQEEDKVAVRRQWTLEVSA